MRHSSLEEETMIKYIALLVVILLYFNTLATPPLQISKIKESNKTKQKIGDNPLEMEEERKSCMFV